MTIFHVTTLEARVTVFVLSLISVRVPPVTFTRMFEPRHNILPDVRTNVGKYVMSWLEHSRESNRPVPGIHLAELSIQPWEWV